MVISIRNPEAPATKRQLWYLHVLTKTDTRNLNVTMAEVDKRIKTAQISYDLLQSKSRPVDKAISTKPLENTTSTAILPPVILLPAPKPKPKINFDIPYWWQPDKDKMLMCRGCRHPSGCHKDKERWISWKLPAKTIKAFDFTFNFETGCNILRAAMLRDVAKAQTSKPKETISYGYAKLPEAFIQTVRVGSHREFIETTPKHGFHRTVEEFTTYYHDNLAGKDWLKEHEHSLKDFEPALDILADGKTISINGNYKKGIVQDFIKASK